MIDSQPEQHDSANGAPWLDTTPLGRALHGERRIVTVLFCDVVGSTAMAERLDPEDWAEIMDDAFNILTAPIARYEGTVARLMGDAVLAFFGAPITHEDDAERAVLAGLDIVRGIQPFRERIKREYGLDFNVRVGINTGPVVVGEIGSDSKVEYTAMGDAVNLAARMEQTAVAGTVQITQHTYRLVAPLFDVYELGGIEVKGKHEPVPAYRVLSREAQPNRLHGIEGSVVPLVGRAHELQLLTHVVDTVRGGRGHIVFLVGDAGLGKSRLLDELHRYWRSLVAMAETAPQMTAAGRTPSVWSVHQGTSYDATRAYSVFRNHLRRTFEIEESDPLEVARQKVARITRDMPPERVAPTMRAVEVLLAVVAGSGASPRQGETLKRDLFEAMFAGWRDLAVHAPTAIVFDDLHWADPASVDLLQHLLPLVEQFPVLFLCAMRPYQRSPGWQVKQIAQTDYADRYTEITLHPLNAVDSNSLIDYLLDEPSLPEALRGMVLLKAEGNPFFVEEVVHALIEGGAVVRDASGVRWQAGDDVDASRLDIPDTVQALLTARIDRLEPDARRTLQFASVIGRTFAYRVLQHASQTGDMLDRHLTTLQRAELIHEAERSPEQVYTFRHELTRDAAYASMLRRQRRAFHRRVAEAIEALFPDRVEEQADRLAHHFDQAGDDGRALRYYTLAGDVAAQLYANVEAVSHYTRALEISRRDTVADVQLLHLYAGRGRALEVGGRFREAIANYQELESLARGRRDRALELAALIPQATIHSTYTAEFNPELGRALSERALALARELNEPRAEAKALWNLMLLTLFAGHDARQAVTYGEQALAIARRHNLREELAYVLHDIARAYFEVGQVEPVWPAQAEALALWRELGNLPMLADTLTSSANRHYWVGNLDQAMTLAQEALRVSQSIGSWWGQSYSLSMIGPLHLERGEVSKGIRAMEEAIACAERANYWGSQVYDRAILAWVYGMLGDVERAFEMAHHALAKSDKFGQRPAPVLAVIALLRLYRGEREAASALIQRADREASASGPGSYPESALFFDLVDGEIALALGDHERVLELAERSIAAMRAMGMRPFLPYPIFFKAHSLLGLGRREAAASAVREARAAIDAQGATYSLFRLRVLLGLSDIEAQIGHGDEARALRRQAREVAATIAGHIDDSQLRASFLARPDVQAVMKK